MDRGVFIGGGLICASFLIAVLLNESAQEPVPMPNPAAVERAAQEQVCDELAPTDAHAKSRRQDVVIEGAEHKPAEDVGCRR